MSEYASIACGLFMAPGSSLVVYPASGFVETAYRAGKPVIIINRENTLNDNIAKYCINEPLAEVKPLIVE